MNIKGDFVHLKEMIASAALASLLFSGCGGSASDRRVRMPETASEAVSAITMSEQSASTISSGNDIAGSSTIDLTEHWTLKADEDENYTVENKNTGQLLSIQVSAPEMPAQVEEFITAVAQVYQIAHDENYTYGDSRTLPPCEDHLISCDRMIARALWNLGYTDQNTGGMTIGNEDEYLTSHGFRKLDPNEHFQRGDILLYERTENGAVSHTCVLTGYNAETGICARYDCGGTTDNPRFARIEPIVDPAVYQYDYAKRIRAAYRFEGVSGGYDSSVSLAGADDTNELSQRWIAEPAGDGGYILRAAIDDSYCITKEDGVLTLDAYPDNAGYVKIQQKEK